MNSASEGVDRLQALATCFRAGEKEIQQLKVSINDKVKMLDCRVAEITVQKRANASRRELLEELEPKSEAARLQVQDLERMIEESKCSQNAQFSQLSEAEQIVINIEHDIQVGMKEFTGKVSDFATKMLAARDLLRSNLGLGHSAVHIPE